MSPQCQGPVSEHWPSQTCVSLPTCVEDAACVNSVTSLTSMASDMCRVSRMPTLGWSLGPRGLSLDFSRTPPQAEGTGRGQWSLPTSRSQASSLTFPPVSHSFLKVALRARRWFRELGLHSSDRTGPEPGTAGGAWGLGLALRLQGRKALRPEQGFSALVPVRITWRGLNSPEARALPWSF